MIFIVLFMASVLGALVHLYVTRSISWTKQRVVEVLLLYFLCVSWGVGIGVATVWGHIFHPDLIAASVGWEPGNPFQVELGFACVGLALLGVLSIWLRGVFWVAPTVGWSVFFLGAAYVHLREMVARGHLSFEHIHPVLVWDLVTPPIVLSLLVIHIRLGGLHRMD
jgi:hypothetical protein